MPTLLSFLLLLPLAGAVLQLCCHRLLPRRLLEVCACLAIGLSCLMAILAFVLSRGRTSSFALYQWIRVADFQASISILYDPAAAVMALMVTFVALLIHVYSVAFMAADKDYGRYFCYLNLFVFNMLVIVLAGDLLFLFLGWEGVGFCSYALIGFWYKENANCLAGGKAFILTRIGDVALLIALAIFLASGAGFSLSEVNHAAPALPPGRITLIGFLLLIAAAGKSAQLPLSVWLPDAMAGPTPVSALIHAATMVTAGVYLLIRLFPVLSLSPAAMTAVAAAGALTALYGAASALAQTDIKRVLAYSTISQVGYMVLGVGGGAIDAALFHLLCHACYKALLFLGAGCLIMACNDEHDIRRLGPGLRRRYPLLFWPFLLAIASLAGIPLTAGFFSKGSILAAAFGSQAAFPLLWWLLGSFTAYLTALYSFRLLYLVFFTSDHGKAGKRRPLPLTMTAVLWPLAVLALLGGLINLPLGTDSGWLTGFLQIAEEGRNHRVPELALGLLDALLALGGLGTAHLLFGRGRVREAIPGRALADFCRQGFGLDRLYQLLFAGPYRAVAAFLWQGVDVSLVDALLLLPGRFLSAAGGRCRLWATGRLTTSLHGFLLGVSLMLILVTLKIYGLW
ncbi:MAG: NADH-quinone oxidoreductase subunit L [Desulfobulbaceae bacterium]|nr:NADH-quinone oxidoreductase subunit L [Desulfobulbaceae bacterium]